MPVWSGRLTIRLEEGLRDGVLDLIKAFGLFNAPPQGGGLLPAVME